MTVVPVSLPPLPLTGGCQCGRARFRITGVPVTFYLCHCRDCQRQSGSAFGQSLWVTREDFRCEGRLGKTARVSDEGRPREGWFCRDCGVRLFNAGPGSAEVTVRGGTLDDAGWLAPAGHIWTASRQRWLAIPLEALSDPGEPASFEPFIARWQDMLAKGGVAKK